MVHAEPTDDQLEQAWRAVGKPDWGTFADLKQAALRYRLVYMHATLLARGIHPNAPTPEPPTPIEPPSPAAIYRQQRRRSEQLHVPHQAPLMDQKRLASGERDED